MLNPAFTFAFEDFKNLKDQIQFHAPLEKVSTALNDGYMKWEINGLGEAYGFWFKLKDSKKPFIVKTMVNVDGLDIDEPIEWFIESETLTIAEQVFKNLELGNTVITWKNSLKS